MTEPGKDHADTSADFGFVLIAVLWTMLILSAIAVGLTYAAKARVQTVHSLVEQQQQRLLADGLAEVIAADWSSGGREIIRSLNLEVDGRKIVCRAGETSIEISLTSVYGLIDLNAAPIGLLTSVYRSAGLSTETAEALAAATIDFRDADNVATPHGAELEVYQSAGRPDGPKNAPFESVAELAQVYGMSREVYERVRDLVTVSSRAAFVDRALAPPEVRGALELGTPNSVDSFGHAAEGSRIVRILVSAGQGRAVTRQVVVEPSPQSKRGYRFLEWLTYRRDRKSSSSALRTCISSRTS